MAVAKEKEPIGTLAKRWKMRKALNSLRAEGVVLTPTQRERLADLPHDTEFTAQDLGVGAALLTMYERMGLVEGETNTERRDGQGRLLKGRIYRLTDKGYHAQQRLRAAAEATHRVRAKFTGGDWDA